MGKQEEGPGKLAHQSARERRRWPRDTDPRDEATPVRPPALEPLVFSTRSLALEDQFPAWQVYMAPLADVRLPDDKSLRDGFLAQHVAWNLGRMIIVQQDTPAHSYVRSAAKLRSSSIDHWCIVLRRRGLSWTEVDGRVVESQPGAVELRSLGFPFRGRATDSECLCLYLPRDLFADVLARFDARNNSVLSGNFATLLADYIKAVEARLRSLSVEDLPQVVQATRDMIVAALGSPADHKADLEQLRGVALMERARRYIQSHLDAPDLGPEKICRALGVSRSRLYQLFEPGGGVVHYIQRRRLLAAHVALSDHVDIRRIIDIAEAVGFSSSANFSRAFSKEFGYSPREARNSESGRSPAHLASLAEGQKGVSFEDWLKALGS